jgi:hypothetical protein
VLETALAELVEQGREHAAFFPDFEHPYYYHVDNRLTAYGDASRWAIVIEQVGVNPRAGVFARRAGRLPAHRR